MTRIILAAILLSAIISCEGPAGPIGPAGPPGAQGAQGAPGVQGPPGQSAAQAVIEHTFHGETDGWDEEWTSYVVSDSRFQPQSGHLIQVWVRRFYTNTGDPYYIEFSEWKDSDFAEYPIYQVRANSVRFYDPAQTLEGHTVLIVIGS